MESLYQKVNPHLAISDSLSAEANAPHPLTPGYYSVIDAAPGEFLAENFWIRQGKLFYGITQQTSATFEAADYFVFYIQNLAQRQDWSSLQTINDAWNSALRAAVKAGNEADRKMEFQAFKNSVIESPDLIWHDKGKLIEKLHERMEAAASLVSHRGFMPSKSVNLSIDVAMEEENGAEAEMTRSREDIIALTL